MEVLVELHQDLEDLGPRHRWTGPPGPGGRARKPLLAELPRAGAGPVELVLTSASHLASSAHLSLVKGTREEKGPEVTSHKHRQVRTFLEQAGTTPDLEEATS